MVGGAGQPGPALDLAVATHPDVVIVDPRLPDVDAGTAFIGRLRELVPDARVLAMCWSGAWSTAASTAAPTASSARPSAPRSSSPRSVRRPAA